MNTTTILLRTGLLLALGLTTGACQDSDAGRTLLDGGGESGDMDEAGDDGWDDDDDDGADGADDDGADDDGAGDDGADDDGSQPVCGDGEMNPELGEQCDDANLDPLDGCQANCQLGPTGLQIDYYSSTPLPLRGGGGGGAFEEECPEGEVVIGVMGRAGAYVDRVQVQCGSVELTSSETGSIQVSVEPGGTMTPQGGGGGGDFSLGCEPGQVVVGFGGRSGSYLDQLSLRCAPVLVLDDPQAGAMSIGFGAAVNTESAGGGGGGSFIAECPVGEVATIARGRAGNFLDAFGLSCRPLELI
ncbi:MAG: DUF4215 domain-containing protein [Nannocystaceae bacterium]